MLAKIVHFGFFIINNNMPTITRKIELKLRTDGLSDEQQKFQRQLLYHINDNLYKAANNISSKLYLDDHVSSMVRLKHAEYLDLLKELARAEKKNDVDLIAHLSEKLTAAEREMTDQELAICKYATEMSTNTLAYRFATEIETDVFGQILATMKQGVHANFQNDSTDVKRGKRAIRNYKRGMAIPFPWNDSLRLSYEKTEPKKVEDDGEYEFYLNWFKGIRFHLHFGKDRSNNRLILKRCFNLDDNCDDDYRIKTSSIKIVKGAKGPEYFLFLVVDIPQEKHVLNSKIVVGVDLGINYPAYVATNITEERKVIGDREHFLKARMALSRRYRSFQRLTGTAGGRGRAKKLEPLERLREKERNWVHTQNHLFSRDVVQFAIQAKAATIQMEDLSGYGRDDDGNVIEDKKFLLGKWSYYELQSMIKYKAQKAGIKVNYVNPAYTSQTCSECGQVQPEARNSVHYICQNPACRHYQKDIPADYNAARNIARSNNIIKS